MLATSKWLGVVLVATSVAVLPFTIWISNDWTFVSAASGLLGCVLLALGMPRRGSPDYDVADDSSDR
jgi:hypothetical protein